MTFDQPTPVQVTRLRSLWQEAFGEWNGFWDTFLETAFSPMRCRCLTDKGEVTAALTWLDCSCRGQKMAYIYAVVTHPEHRGKGLCRVLLENTHTLLAAQGYAAALLVPAEEGLRQMYRKLGYESCTCVAEFTCEAGAETIPLRAVGAAEFASLRREYLPEGGVLQEGEALPFLSRQAQFFAGGDFLLTAYCEADTLTAPELLGNRAAGAAIVRTLGCKTGRFRCPGEAIPFAMWHPLTENVRKPAYFGFAFD